MVPVKLIGEGSGKSASDAERYRNISELVAREDTSHRAVSSDSEVLKVPPSPKGGFRSYLSISARSQSASRFSKCAAQRAGR